MRKRILFYSLIIVVISFPLVSKAAKLSVVANDQMGVGGDILVTIVANADKPINAIEGQINWPADLLTVKDIRTANSVINFWVNPPTATKQTINFTGITPGGFVGEKGQVFSIVFHSEKPGVAVIDFSNVKMLLNNNQGSPAVLDLKPSNIKISPDLGVDSISNNFNDKELPETFQPVIGRDPNLLDGKNFLVFSTVDKNSGIISYQVKEVKHRLFSYFATWQEAVSPYVLLDQTLHSYIYVKAVDRAGNERVVKLNPQLTTKWYESIWFWGIIILVILFLVATRIKNDQTD